MTPKQVHDTPSSQDAITHRIWDYNNRHAKETIILRNQGHSDRKMVCDNPQPQDPAINLGLLPQII